MELSNDISALKDLVSVLLRRIEVLESENAALRAENAELRSRLNLNSKNSHKPPSSDGLSKKPGLPKGPPKKSGGQFGHKGRTLKMVEQADNFVLHHAPSCTCCARVFSASDVVFVEQRRQVFDIPAPCMEVTEHQSGVIPCCGRLHVGSFPPEVGQPVQYGSRIKALSVLLNNDYKIPLQKIERLMGDLWGCTFNESTALTANADLYEALHPAEEQIKRGREALESDASLLKDFTNRAVHDCWASYFDFDRCKHALCGAHLLRELTNLTENGSKWASQMHRFLLKLYVASQKGTQPVADPPNWLREFEQICQSADREEPPPKQGKRGKPKNSKGRNLLNRLVKHRDEWLVFAFEQNVPFTNNLAERDIRCLKTKQKVATNFQTFKGAQHYARIQSFTSTLRKHSMNVFQNLINALDRKDIVFQAG